DTACRLGFGHAMGPLATTDLTGVDVLMHATRNIYTDTADEKFFPPELLQRMVTAGALGRKSGKGFYTYCERSRGLGCLQGSPPHHQEVGGDPCYHLGRASAVAAGGPAEGAEAEQ